MYSHLILLVPRYGTVRFIAQNDHIASSNLIRATTFGND
jgi:hypothetical protein